MDSRNSVVKRILTWKVNTVNNNNVRVLYRNYCKSVRFNIAIDIKLIVGFFVFCRLLRGGNLAI